MHTENWMEIHQFYLQDIEQELFYDVNLMKKLTKNLCYRPCLELSLNTE